MFQSNFGMFTVQARAFLDYYGLNYDVVEVNSVMRKDFIIFYMGLLRANRLHFIPCFYAIFAFNLFFPFNFIFFSPSCNPSPLTTLVCCIMYTPAQIPMALPCKHILYYRKKSLKRKGDERISIVQMKTNALVKSIQLVHFFVQESRDAQPCKL